MYPRFDVRNLRIRPDKWKGHPSSSILYYTTSSEYYRCPCQWGLWSQALFFRSRAERKARGRIIPAIEAVWVILYPPWASARLLLVIGGDKGFFPIEASQRRVSEIEGLIRDKSGARRELTSKSSFSKTSHVRDGATP